MKITWKTTWFFRNFLRYSILCAAGIMQYMKMTWGIPDSGSEDVVGLLIAQRPRSLFPHYAPCLRSTLTALPKDRYILQIMERQQQHNDRLFPDYWRNTSLHLAWHHRKNLWQCVFGIEIQRGQWLSGILFQKRNLIKWLRSKRKCDFFFHKHFRYLLKMVNIMFTIISAIKWAKFHLSHDIITKLSLFGYAIYPSADAQYL